MTRYDTSRHDQCPQVWTEGFAKMQLRQQQAAAAQAVEADQDEIEKGDGTKPATKRRKVGKKGCMQPGDVTPSKGHSVDTLDAMMGQTPKSEYKNKTVEKRHQGSGRGQGRQVGKGVAGAKRGKDGKKEGGGAKRRGAAGGERKGEGERACKMRKVVINFDEDEDDR